MGMLTGSVLVPYITTLFTTWFCLLLLLSIHLYTNYRAVRAVCLPTLNCQRACIVFSDFLVRRNALKYIMLDEEVKAKYRLLKPREVFKRERIFANPSLLRHGDASHGRCRIGVPMAELMSLVSIDSFIFQARLCDALPYILVCNLETGVILISLNEQSQRIYLQAWFHAMVLVMAWNQAHTTKDTSDYEGILLCQAALRIGRFWDELELGLVDAGWNIDDVAILTVGRSTVTMGDSGKAEDKKEI